MLKKIQEHVHEDGLYKTFVFVLSKIWWLIFEKIPSERERRHPLPVQRNKILFESFDEHRDNAVALYQYMMEQGYDHFYEFVWLADHPRSCRKILGRNVRVIKKRLACEQVTTKAFREIHSSKYVFYTVAMNWVKLVQKDQVYIDLWHGCSFKSTGHSFGRWVFFDYLLVPGPFFVPLKAEAMDCPPEKILPIGYPRYDIMMRSDPKTRELVQALLKKHGAKKLVLWMPTYRKATSLRLNENTLDESEYDLPIVYSHDMLMHLDRVCVDTDVLIMIKRHIHSSSSHISTKEMNRIMYIDDEWLTKQEISLYALLHETNALITDYSSIGIDYLLLDRPLAFTLDDYEKYKASRGFTIDNPLDYMPGHYIYQFEDMEAFIRDVSDGKDRYSARRKDVSSRVHISCDCYCQKVLDTLNISINETL